MLIDNIFFPKLESSKNSKKIKKMGVSNLSITGTEVNPESWTQLKGSNET